jgi:hypothetical protein
MQTDGMLSERKNYSLLQTIRFVWKQDGWHGFYKGLTMNWIKVCSLDRSKHTVFQRMLLKLIN